MGEVYLAEDPNLRREIAIKVLPTVYASTPQMRARFIREAIAASTLKHPNVGVVYEAGETDDGIAYIAMEYIEGQTLHDRLESGRIPIAEAVRIAVQIADALDEAHRHGVIHRDIKPGNIMLDERGRVKVVDFGLAKLAELAEQSATMDRSLTAAGAVVGTAQYMSPEQVQGLTLDSRSDLFSLGIVIYEMIAGRNPFAADSQMDLLARIREATPPPPSKIRTESPPDLDRIVRKSLEKDRDRRYQTARDLMLDLEQVGQEPAKSTRKLAAWAVGAVAMLMVIAAALFFRPRAEHQVLPARNAVTSVAVLPFVNMSADPGNDYIADGTTEEVINSLAQLKNVKVVSRTSVFAFKGKNADIREIGRKLNVGSIVEGSVRASGKRLRMTAQLINVADGYHLWSKTYDRTVDDIFAIQDEIATGVAAAMRAGTVAGGAPTHDLVAYAAYVQGRRFASSWTSESLDRALMFYREATDRDPQFADAWAGQAHVYSLLDHVDSPTPPSESYRLATETALKALAIDPRSADAEAALGHIDLHLGKFDEAERHLQAALAINPNLAEAHAWYSLYLRTARQDFERAKSEVAKALELDPLDAQWFLVASNVYLYAGAYDRCIETARRGREIDPDSEAFATLAATAYALEGKFTEAGEAMRKLPAGSGLETKALVAALQGRREEALSILTAGKHRPSNFAALAYAAAGDIGAARRAVQMFAAADANYARMAIKLPPHAAFAALARDKGFRDVQRKLGLPDSPYP